MNVGWPEVVITLVLLAVLVGLVFVVRAVIAGFRQR